MPTIEQKKIKRTYLSDLAMWLFDKMGHGSVLRIEPEAFGFEHRNPGLGADQYWGREYLSDHSVQEFRDAFSELHRAALVRRLTEHRNDAIVGWRETGLDGGEGVEFWCCMQ